MVMQRRFLGIRDCAEYLGVTKGTLYVWVCHRKIPYVKVGRLVKFDLVRIDKWLASNTVESYNVRRHFKTLDSRFRGNDKLRGVGR